MRCRFEYGNAKVCAVVNLLGKSARYLSPAPYTMYWTRLLEWKEMNVYKILLLTFGKIWKFFCWVFVHAAFVWRPNFVVFTRYIGDI